MSAPEAAPVDAREASLRPFRRASNTWWLTVGLLGAVVLVGIVAWIIQLIEGMGVAGYNDHAFWAIYIADVVTFIGVSYGGAVVSAILRLTGATWRAPLTRLAEGTAVVTVLVGAALIVPHIGRPELLWELVSQPNLSAPVFWDFIAVMTYMTASIVFFALPLIPDMALLHSKHGPRLGRRRVRLYAWFSCGWVGAPHQRRVLSGALGLISIMIIPLAVAVHSVLAWAFATTTRPWWHESIWAPQFVVAALYSGVALVILVVAAFRRGYHLEHLIVERHFVRLGAILVTFAAGYLYFTFADILPGAYTAEGGTAKVFSELLVGHLSGYFWMFVVVGAVVPLLLVALPWTRNTRGIVIASALVVPMMWLKRMLMVVAPATYDTVTGAFGQYNFTWIAVAITLAALAAVPLLLMILFRIVPLLSIDEIDEIDEIEKGRKSDGGDQFAQATSSRVPTRGAARVGATGGIRQRVVGTGVLVLVALVGVLGISTSPPALATASPADQGTSPRISISGVEVGGLMELSATVTAQDGQPIIDTDVAFGFTTTQFGEPGRLVPLGSVRTDRSGIARLTLGGDADHLYQPTTEGPQEFVASYTADGAQAVTASTTVTVAAARSAYDLAPPKPLAEVGKVLVWILFVAVAAIWLTLATLVVRVRRSCTHPRMREPASA